MKLYIEGKEIPVTWEQNASARELAAAAAEKEIIVAMSMYGGNEQFGPLGRTFSRDDRRVTARCGDIVLYCGDQIVVFFGSNTWSYTKLGKIELSEAEVTALLSQGDVTLTLAG